MARGFKTGGRKQGSKNKRTVEREAAAAATIAQVEEAIGESFKGDAHAFLVAVYKDPKNPIELRVNAAKAAIRFEKPALAATEIANDITRHYVALMPAPVRDIDEWKRLVEMKDKPCLVHDIADKIELTPNG